MTSLEHTCKMLSSKLRKCSNLLELMIQFDIDDPDSIANTLADLLDEDITLATQSNPELAPVLDADGNPIFVGIHRYCVRTGEIVTVTHIHRADVYKAMGLLPDVSPSGDAVVSVTGEHGYHMFVSSKDLTNTPVALDGDGNRVKPGALMWSIEHGCWAYVHAVSFDSYERTKVTLKVAEEPQVGKDDPDVLRGIHPSFLFEDVTVYDRIGNVIRKGDSVYVIGGDFAGQAFKVSDIVVPNGETFEGNMSEAKVLLGCGLVDVRSIVKEYIKS